MTETVSQESDLSDLLSDEAINRPEVYYAKLRALNPVLWNPRWNGWIVTGYDAVAAGFRDSERLSSDRFSGPFGRGSRRWGASWPSRCAMARRSISCRTSRSRCRWS